MKYILSPEFQRQAWTRFSPLRLVAAPLIMLLCVISTNNLPKQVLTVTQIDVSSMLYVSLAIYYLVVIVWGTYEAATSMQEEMRGNTWDFQRMSAISPAQLAFGKLFGAASYAWYFGLMALTVIGYAYYNHSAPEVYYGKAPEFPFPEPDDDTLYFLFCLVAAGVIAQSLAFAYSFADNTILFGRAGRGKPPRGIWAFFLGVGAGTMVFSRAVGKEGLHLHPRVDVMFHHFDFSWFGYDVGRESFTVLSLLFFIGWFLCGGYRLARSELSYRNTPAVWVAFVATVVAWYSGFLVHSGNLSGGIANYFPALFSGFVQVLFISYACMLTEAGDTRRYTRLFRCLRARDIGQVLENIPKWASTLPLVALLYFAVLATAPETYGRFDFAHVTMFMSCLVLFALRDGLVIHGIHLHFRGRSTSFAVLFYYVLAYGLLPLVSVTSLSLQMGDIVGAIVNSKVPDNVGHIAGAFFPTTMLDPGKGLLPVFAEAAAAGWWFYTGLRKNKGSDVIANKA